MNAQVAEKMVKINSVIVTDTISRMDVDGHSRFLIDSVDPSLRRFQWRLNSIAIS